MCSMCEDFGQLTPYAPCDICHERGNVKIQRHYDNGRFTKEQYECLLVTRNFNQHEQTHSELLDVCVDTEMLNLVEYINAIGLKTSFSCLEQRVSRPGIVVKKTSEVEVSSFMQENAPHLHDMITYHEWRNGILTDVTLYFDAGVPEQFRP